MRFTYLWFYSLVVLIKSFSTHKCTHRATGIHLFICFYSLVVLIKSFSTHKRIQSSVWSFLKINVLPSVTGFTYLFLYFYCVDQNNSQPTNILQFKYSVITVEFPQIRFLLLLHSVLSLLSWKLLAIPPTGGGRERGRMGIGGRKEEVKRGAYDI